MHVVAFCPLFLPLLATSSTTAYPILRLTEGDMRADIQVPDRPLMIRVPTTNYDNSYR